MCVCPVRLLRTVGAADVARQPRYRMQINLIAILPVCTVIRDNCLPKPTEVGRVARNQKLGDWVDGLSRAYTNIPHPPTPRVTICVCIGSMFSPGDQIELLCFGYAICLELCVSGDYEVVNSIVQHKNTVGKDIHMKTHLTKYLPQTYHWCCESEAMTRDFILPPQCSWEAAALLGLTRSRMVVDCRRFGTAYRYQLECLKMGLQGCPETSV